MSAWGGCRSPPLSTNAIMSPTAAEIPTYYIDEPLPQAVDESVLMSPVAAATVAVVAPPQQTITQPQGANAELTWPNEEERIKFVIDTPVLTRYGLEKYAFAGGMYKVDQMTHELAMTGDADMRSAAIDTLLTEMNGDAVWNQAFESNTSDADKRVYAQWPGKIQPPPADGDLKHVFITVGAGMGVTSQCLPKLMSDLYNGASDTPSTLYSYLNPQSLRDNLAEERKGRQSHIKPLVWRVVDAQNNTCVPMSVGMENASMMEPGKFMVPKSAVGLCDAFGPGISSITIPAGHKGPLVSELSRMWRAPRQSYHSPEKARWSTVDLDSAKKEAEQFRAKDGLVMHFPYPIEDPLQPKTLAEYVLISHSRQLREAHEMLELASARANPNRKPEIKIPHVIKVKAHRDASVDEQMLVVNTAAFEKTLEWLYKTFAGANDDISLSGPMRASFKPYNGAYGVKALGCMRDEPVSLGVTVELIYVMATTADLHHPAIFEQKMTPANMAYVNHVRKLKKHLDSGGGGECATPAGSNSALARMRL